jgi:hypothetical protein
MATGSLPNRPGFLHRHRKLLMIGVIGFLLVSPGVKPEPSNRVQAPPAAALPANPEPRPGHAAGPVEPLPEVWLVETAPSHEIYSNGLRIETAGAVANAARAWVRLELATGEIRRGDGPPVGIVFHSTESHIAPFAPSENARLRHAGESVLDYVRRNRSYHYLVDRFGRVHRVVAESDAAFHAGNSVWGDERQVWLNLNESFLGVSLEAVTAGEHGDRDPITPAQQHALKTLTAMLRSRYSIPAANCVTHAQVSVNPNSRLLGHHTDWASGFPFTAIGLPDNYALPLASMTAFGFGYDPDFLAAGAAAWTGLALSEARVRRQAAAAQTTVVLHRALLHETYLSTISRIAREKETNP